MVLEIIKPYFSYASFTLFNIRMSRDNIPTRTDDASCRRKVVFALACGFVAGGLVNSCGSAYILNSRVLWRKEMKLFPLECLILVNGKMIRQICIEAWMDVYSSFFSSQ